MLMMLYRTGDPTWCPRQMILDGQCDGSGAMDSFLEFLGKLGASATLKNCSCVNQSNNKRLFKCDVVCG